MIRKAPTIQDVAHHAQVSTATVSRALSTPERVSLQTRERVEAAIAATGYTVNQAARSLRRQNSDTILVALTDIGNPFFSTVLDAIERTAVSAGFSTLVANPTHDPMPHLKLAEHLQSHRADGLLLLDGDMDLEHLVNLFPDSQLPPIVIACEAFTNPHLPAVKTDNTTAARMAVAHLAELGHRHIGHVAGPVTNMATSERHEGFTAELVARGLPVNADWVYPGDFSIASGTAAAKTFLAQSDRPTAVSCSNDEMALGFISEVQAAGIAVPQELSVIGFDDIEWAALFAPALTTMRQPRAELGRLATQALVDILNSPTSAAATTQMLGAELIVRNSTAPLAPSLVRPASGADTAAE